MTYFGTLASRPWFEERRIVGCDVYALRIDTPSELSRVIIAAWRNRMDFLRESFLAGLNGSQNPADAG